MCEGAWPTSTNYRNSQCMRGTAGRLNQFIRSVFPFTLFIVVFPLKSYLDTLSKLVVYKLDIPHADT